MSFKAALADSSVTMLRRLTIWLYRVIAIVLFVVGIQYWARLLGIDAEGLGRFDLMPVWWKIAAPALAVLYPVAGIGLWLLAGWGAVIWVMIALGEATMHLGFPELYGDANAWLGFHVAGLLLLMALRIVDLRERRRIQRHRTTNGSPGTEGRRPAAKAGTTR